MAKCFETVLLGCPVTPTEARNGKARLNIKCLGGKAWNSEHFSMIAMTRRLEARVSQTRHVRQRFRRVYVWAPVVPKRKQL